VEEAMANVEMAGKYEPGGEKDAMEEAYRKWKGELKQVLQTSEK
jgi:hypothetical protein